MNQVLPSLKSLLLVLVLLPRPLVAAEVIKAGTDAPVIDEQPIGRVATAGGHVTLSVLAHGTAPLRFQWFTNNHAQAITNSARLGGATNSVLNIDPAFTTDSGGYSVVVSNGGGSVTSVVAGVTVNSLLVAPTVTGTTGVIVQLTGQIGDVYRMELNENFTGYKTNGYATNRRGTVSYPYRWPNDSTFRQRREAVDQALPVLTSSNAPSAPGLRAYGRLNQVWNFQATTNFVNWDTLLTVTNTNGWVKFSDPTTPRPARRFYRIAP